jgi:hypothetical protein
MAIVIEDGSNVAGANSYATAAQLTAYAAERGVTVTGVSDVLLIQAMDALEDKNFIGTKANFDQPLQWPRLGVQIDGYSIASNVIPDDLISSQIEIAIAIDGGTNPLANQSRETLREKIGDIEVEYAPSARAITYLAAAEAKLSRLVRKFAGIVRV